MFYSNVSNRIMMILLVLLGGMSFGYGVALLLGGAIWMKILLFLVGTIGYCAVSFKTMAAITRVDNTTD